MRRSDFRYELPLQLIAREPLAKRRASRMLFVNRETGERRDDEFRYLPHYLRAGDILVLNNTRVIPARLYGHKETGGKIEVLVERVEDDNRVLAQLRASKSPLTGARLTLDPGVVVEVEGRQDDFYRLRFLDARPVTDILEQGGHVPLPPYIDRPDNANDRRRYQTVYAQHPGAVAAPTAGLHFDDEMLATLRAQGVETAFVTLHVGAGTFQPVRAERLEDHHMHSEYLEVSAETCARIDTARARGGRVWAVGTTVVRSLETAAGEGELRPFSGHTRLFIAPGFEFRVVDALLTNFHLPESTLLMLVCAFAGYQNTLAAYRYAVEQQYRFFSYGDAMLIA